MERLSANSPTGPGLDSFLEELLVLAASQGEECLPNLTAWDLKLRIQSLHYGSAVTSICLTDTASLLPQTFSDDLLKNRVGD